MLKKAINNRLLEAFFIKENAILYIFWSGLLEVFLINGVLKVDYSKLSLSKKTQYCIYILKQPARGIIKKRRSENMQQIYRRTHMSKCDFNNVALHVWVAASIYWEIFAKLWLITLITLTW